MGCKFVVLSLLLCFDIIGTTKVELFSEWKPGSGWQIECSWTLYSNDSLQSVRLYDNDQQFMIYRPERDSQQRSQTFKIHGNPLIVTCAETADRGYLGRCVLNLELYEPPKNNFNFSCEVSGERPTFRMDKMDITIHNFVPPSEASIHVITVSGVEQVPGRVTLNCTATGLPAPELEWEIGSQRVPRDFSGSVWNMQTKLWHVWSLLSYTPTSEGLAAQCTPESSTNGQLVLGGSAMYNNANGIHGTLGSLIITPLFLILLSRL